MDIHYTDGITLLVVGWRIEEPKIESCKDEKASGPCKPWQQRSREAVKTSWVRILFYHHLLPASLPGISPGLLKYGIPLPKNEDGNFNLNIKSKNFLTIMVWHFLMSTQRL